jgi:hypothetical protein
VVLEEPHSYQPERPGALGAAGGLPAGPLLAAAIEAAESDGAYLYRIARDSRYLDLAVWRGLEPIHAGHFAVAAAGGA